MAEDSQSTAGSEATERIMPNPSVNRRPRGANIQGDSRSGGTERRSTSTVSQHRRRELEYQAAQRRYEIQRKLLEDQARLEIERINQQLNMDLERMEEESEDLRSIITRRTQEREIHDQNKIHQWLNNVNPADINNIETENNEDRQFPNPSGKEPSFQNTREENRFKERLVIEDETRHLLQRITVGKKLPVFEGDVLEWQCFKRAFEETTKKGGFSEEENLLRLYESLKGPAKEAVSSLMITTRDTRQIMKLLELRFGNSNAVADRIIQDIKSLPKIYNNNGDLIVFATKVRNCVAALEAVNHTGYLHSPDLQREIIQKIPYAMVYNYNRYLDSQQETTVPALVTLSKFLFYEAEIACKAGTFDTSAATSQQKRDNTKSKDRNQNFQTGNNRNNRKSSYRPWERVGAINQNEEIDSLESKKAKLDKTCSFCDQQSHHLDDCKSFKETAIPDRWAWARKNGICFKCLKSSSHLQNECRAPACKISNCKGNHHTFLHSNKTNRLNDSKTSKPNNNLVANTNENQDSESNER